MDKNKLLELRGMTLIEMEQLVKELKEPEYRAKQLFRWVHRYGASSWAEMKNLPLEFHKDLALRCLLDNAKILEVIWSAEKDTAKCLIELPDGEKIEAVLMIYKGAEQRHRQTACVSTQVGCQMGCSFCATGLTGWQRNLTAGEILGQVLAMRSLLIRRQPISNIVFMGMGEPLMNYQNLIRTIRLLNSPEGMNISIRRITVSTCGLPHQIRLLAEENLPVVLAVSLHAPTDALRSELMPINKKYPLDQLLAACCYYSKRTGRRVTFEYALIRGVNDRPEQAEKLCKLLEGLLCNVNLIPINPLADKGWQRSRQGETAVFAKRLQSCGIETVIRKSMGEDIEAACGQLRRRHVEKA
jgi:23S rRNA (adenine2503-C2)-methyltransferase